jgi:bifunctional enzyme CysN/CysC
MTNYDEKIFSIVTVGHVDHGKSTLVGNLLYQLGSLPDGKVEQIKNICKSQNRIFEYAFILDALKEEQRQGITIDIARIFFRSKKRSYQFIDAPGHVDFLKNMVTGAARANAAILVIDASEGIKENTKRHSYILSFLGIKTIIVAINKMDLAKYDHALFTKLSMEITEHLSTLDLSPVSIIPVCANTGMNLINSSNEMAWNKSGNLIENLDNLKLESNRDEDHFNLFVQDVYKFGNENSQRTIVGKVLTGAIKNGSQVMIHPTKSKSHISLTDKNKDTFYRNENVSFTLDNINFVSRGDLITNIKNKITTSKTWIVDIFWTGPRPLEKNKFYILRHGNHKTQVRISKIIKALKTDTLEIITAPESVLPNQTGEVLLHTQAYLNVDLESDKEEIKRFVIVDNFEISGGGKIKTESKELNNFRPNQVIKEFSTITPQIGGRSNLFLMINLEEECSKLMAKAYKNQSREILAIEIQSLSSHQIQEQMLLISSVLSCQKDLLIQTKNVDREIIPLLKENFSEINFNIISKKQFGLHQIEGYVYESKKQFKELLDVILK